MLADLILTISNHRQSAKFNSTPNFPAIRYIVIQYIIIIAPLICILRMCAALHDFHYYIYHSIGYRYCYCSMDKQQCLPVCSTIVGAELDIIHSFCTPQRWSCDRAQANKVHLPFPPLTLVLHSVTVFYCSNYCRTRLSSVIELVAELIRSLSRENEQGAVKRSSLLVLQNVIFLLTHKNGILRALLNSKVAPAVNCFHWRHRILYSTDMATLYNNQDHSNDSKDHSATSSYSSIGPNSKLTGKSSMPYKLHSSSQNLVASSKSLLSSRSNLLKASNEFKNSGIFSTTLTTDLASSRRSMPTKCMVHCGESIVPYGFEYQGLQERLVLTPETEACVLSVVNSFARFNSCSLHGGPVSGKTETVREIAKVFYYIISCTRTVQVCVSSMCNTICSSYCGYNYCCVCRWLAGTCLSFGAPLQPASPMCSDCWQVLFKQAPYCC